MILHIVSLYVCVWFCYGYNLNDEYEEESSNYHKENFRGDTEEANALFRNLTQMDRTISHRLKHPISNDGEKLCNDIISYNEEFDTVVKPTGEHKLHIFKIAKLIIDSQGPCFIKSSPDFEGIQKLNQWTDQRLGYLCRQIVTTKLMWRLFKEDYLDMSLTYYYKHIF